jgi:hypothetical protein
VLLRDGLAAAELGEVDPQQEPAAAGDQVAADTLADRNLDTEFFAAFADQRLGLGLVGFDLAAGELPLPRELGRVGAGGGEDAGSGADRGADDDGERLGGAVPGLGLFGAWVGHGGSLSARSDPSRHR